MSQRSKFQHEESKHIRRQDAELRKLFYSISLPLSGTFYGVNIRDLRMMYILCYQLGGVFQPGALSYDAQHEIYTELTFFFSKEERSDL